MEIKDNFQLMETRDRSLAMEIKNSSQVTETRNRFPGVKIKDGSHSVKTRGSSLVEEVEEDSDVGKKKLRHDSGIRWRQASTVVFRIIRDMTAS
ncbi:unnamed protein product [Enterobius vermicularis]|uniref:Uncharacterized protein n=1 Tax=Enterobius vermicularis TaxID=51028 RepID=A0A0N4VIN6_ENTVE|nr:unnamed protein product [Enterobius vermicularis]